MPRIAESGQPRNLIKVKKNVKFNLFLLLSFVAVFRCYFLLFLLFFPRLLLHFW